MAWLPGQRITPQRLLDNTPHTVDWATLTSNVDNITSTERLLMTSNALTFGANRAYRVTFTSLVRINDPGVGAVIVNNGMRFNLKQNAISGRVVRTWWNVQVDTVTDATNVAVNLQAVATVGASPVMGSLAVTCQHTWGTDPLSMGATVGTPTSLHIEDIGEAVLFPGAATIA